MPRLTFRYDGRAATDRGAVAPLVAVLLAAGVLLGMGAWVVDLGLAYAERGQVVNAAGAAALAAAEHCVQPGSRTCGQPGAVQAVADANAHDGQMSIDTLCGVDRLGDQLNRCAAASGGGAAQCLTAAPTGVSYVEVHAGTRTADGKSVLPPVFSQGAGPHVGGCARVAWGPPRGPYAGIGLSDCAFKATTDGIGDAAGFQAPPPKNIPDASVEHVIPLETPGGPGDDTCDDVVYYAADGNCRRQVDPNTQITGWVNPVAGGTPPPGCAQLVRDKEVASYADPQPYLLMPIYSGYARDQVEADGKTTFRIVGIAAFRVTGDKLTADPPAGDVLDHSLSADDFCRAPATSATRCIRGYFVWAHIIDGRMPATGWTTNYGVAAYKTVG